MLTVFVKYVCYLLLKMKETVVADRGGLEVFIVNTVQYNSKTAKLFKKLCSTLYSFLTNDATLFGCTVPNLNMYFFCAHLVL
jgi:hypothetical protein